MLRSDDTDTARNDPHFHEDILAGLRWLGLDWDEGVELGGPHGSYRQSDRLERYRTVAADLVQRRLAYRCFCTSDELEARRKQARDAGNPPGYDGRCRLLDSGEAGSRAGAGERHSVRLAVARPGTTVFTDVIRGEVRFDHANVDDFVMLRSSGMPTYHLASTVDDVDYAISHVIRGEDLLPSTPKHILITCALGAKPAVYAHLPLIQGTDGRKLSKRHGDTAVRAYRDAGYLPEAVVNYLALLGWSGGGGDEETVVSLPRMVEAFRLEDVSKNPAVFDSAKLLWLNGLYIRQLPAERFAAMAEEAAAADLGRPLNSDEQKSLLIIVPLVQERVKLLTEIAGQVRFLFGDDATWDAASWDKVMTGETAATAVNAAIDVLDPVASWSHVAIEAALRSMLAATGLSARKGLQPVRVAVTGSVVSPPLFESLQALGGERTIRRLRAAAARIAGSG